MESTLKTAFVDELRRILPDLYDLDVLGHSPLVPLFGLTQHPDAPSQLQHILTDSIEALRPDADIPPRSKAWRFFNILHTRYKEQYTQQEVALDLSLSIRQVRRQEKIAQRVLADYLWSHYNLEQHAPLLDPAAEGREQLDTPSPDQELAWLEESIPNEEISADILIQSVLETTQPHVQAHSVIVQSNIPLDLPSLTVHPTTVRQAILHIITTAARYAPEGRINITAQALPQKNSVEIKFEAQRAGRPPLNSQKRDYLDIAKKLISISAGSKTFTRATEAEIPFTATIMLPVFEECLVLIVDDNADTLTLLERYLSDSRFQFAGTSNPQEVLTLAEKINPDIIVLDVMLPGVDGWELLGRLREYPHTGDVPVIVCTILPQEEFAVTLGAAAFLRKPVSRKALLATLDQVLRKAR
jgi:CheY-like chemotaxis protein